jgi:hypothetical protein
MLSLESPPSPIPSSANTAAMATFFPSICLSVYCSWKSLLQRKQTELGHLYLFLFQALFHETKQRIVQYLTKDNENLKRKNTVVGA